MFAVIYMAVPLGILLGLGHDLLLSIGVMSGAMTLLLAILIGLAYRVSKKFDRGEVPSGRAPSTAEDRPV